MTNPDIGTARRLLRLERVLAGRQARLRSSLARRQAQALDPALLDGLQRYGYLAAVVLAVAAVAPTVLGFAWRRRRLLGGAAMDGVGFWNLHRRYDKVRRSGR